MTAQFLTDHAAIREWLARYCEIKGELRISPEGLVSVGGIVKLNSLAQDELTHFAVQFERVLAFHCVNCSQLQSLTGSPRHVSGVYTCLGCVQLVSLEGAPAYVGGSFNCSLCHNLETLEGAPANVGVFACDGCAKLRNLMGAPTVVRASVYCQRCPNLTTLEGAPAFVGDNFYCYDCPSLMSVQGAQRITGYLEIPNLPKPDPAMVMNLLHQRIKLKTSQKAKWVSIVNNYHKSGDLLPAIAQFEKYFKVPFSSSSVPPPTTTLDLVL